MKICIFQTGEPLHIDKGNYRPMRCMLLADKLIDKGHKVSIISSAFFHQRKIHRSKNLSVYDINDNLKYIAMFSVCCAGQMRYIILNRFHQLSKIRVSKFSNNELI